jgi:hypothetical protein
MILAPAVIIIKHIVTNCLLVINERPGYLRIVAASFSTKVHTDSTAVQTEVTLNNVFNNRVESYIRLNMFSASEAL